MPSSMVSNEGIWGRKSFPMGLALFLALFCSNPARLLPPRSSSAYVAALFKDLQTEEASGGGGAKKKKKARARPRAEDGASVGAFGVFVGTLWKWCRSFVSSESLGRVLSIFKRAYYLQTSPTGLI